MTKKAKKTKLPLKKKSIRQLNESGLRHAAGGFSVPVANPSVRPTMSVAQSSGIGVNDAGGSGAVADSLAKKGGATSIPTGSTASHKPTDGNYGI